MVTTGYIVLAAAMLLLSKMSLSTTLPIIIVLHMCTFFGTSLINTPVQTNSLNQLPKEYNAHGVAIANTTQQIAAAFGSSLFIGLMGAVQAGHLSKYRSPDISQQHTALISGVDVAFTAALILVVIGLILSFFIKRREKGPVNRSLEKISGFECPNSSSGSR